MSSLIKCCLLVIFLLSNGLYAETIFTECHNCSSTNDFKVIATYIGEQSPQNVDEVIVSNIDYNNSRKYRVVYFQSFEPGVPGYTVTEEIPLNSIDINAISQAVQMKKDMHDKAERGVDIPAEIADSYWDLLGQGTSTPNDIRDYIKNDGWTVVNYLVHLLGVYTNLLNDSIPFIVNVNLPDGSIATFEWELSVFGLKNPILLYIVNKDNVSIPITKSNLLNLSSFTVSGESNISSLTEAMDRYNLDITFTGNTTSGGGSYVCRPTESGVACQRV